MKRLFFFALGVLFLWAIALRVYALSVPSYWMDEGFSIALANAITDHGYPLVDSGRVLWRSALYHYSLAPVVSLFGTGETATRFLSVVAGIFAIAVVAALTRSWFGKRAGIIVAALMSFSYWEIAWSRQARMYMMLQLFFWLTILLTHCAVTRRKKRWIVFASFAAIATFFTHEFGAFVFVPCALLFFFSRARNSHRSLIVFVSYWGTVITIAIAAVLFLKSKGFPVPLDYSFHYAQFLVREYADLLVLAFVGIVLMIRRDRALQERAMILVATFITPLAIFSYAFPLLQYRYLFFVTPVFIITSAYALARVSNMQWRTFPKKINAVAGGSLVALFFILSPSMILWPRVHFPLESDPEASRLLYRSITPQPDFRGAYDAANVRGDLPLYTPYPTLSRLYRDTDDAGALFFDLTGGLQGEQGIEIYTGVPFVRLSFLEDARAQGEHGLIMLDMLSASRLDPAFRAFISSLPEIYRKRSGEWSEVWVAEF